MAKIVVTNPIFPEVEHRLSQLGDVIVNRGGALWSREELTELLHDADALLAFMTDSIDGRLLSRSRQLKIIACALKGYDNFDLEACTRAGVWLTIAPDLLTTPTAELAVALTLGLCRNLLAGDHRLRSGKFEGWRAELYGLGLDGAKIGIAGLGRVGLAIAERLRGFRAQLYGFDQRLIAPATLAQVGVSQVGWNEIVANSDVIILALPLNEQTFHLVDSKVLRRMRVGTHIVNIGRGSVVDETSVTQFLEDNHLGGYAADVFEEDWSRQDRPRVISPRLLALRDRTLFTPHLGSAVSSVRLAIERSAANSIEGALSGRTPDNAINDIRST